MTIQLHINDQPLACFEIEEPDLPGWENVEARVKTREYYLQQFFLEKEPVLRNMKNTSFYLIFKSKIHEIQDDDA